MNDITPHQSKPLISPTEATVAAEQGSGSWRLKLRNPMLLLTGALILIVATLLLFVVVVLVQNRSSVKGVIGNLPLANHSNGRMIWS